MRISATESAITGMQWAQEMLDRAAARIATSEPDGSGDIIEDIVDLKLAKHLYAANLVVLKEDQEMKDHLLDIFA